MQKRFVITELCGASRYDHYLAASSIRAAIKWARRQARTHGGRYHVQTCNGLFTTGRRATIAFI